MPRRNRTPQPQGVAAGEWSRPRLWSLLVGALVVTLALLAGLLWSVTVLLGGEVPGTDTHQDDTPRPDEAGLGPELRVNEETLSDALPGTLSHGTAGVITLPSATSIGPAGVPTGFPRTREGALAQLIALDRAALESLSVPRAQDVIRAWAATGGPDMQSWSVITGLTRLLSTAGQPATGTTALSLRADAAMGQFPDADDAAGSFEAGPRQVIGCVDLLLTLTVAASSSEQIAAADCQRLFWQGDRWVIAAGPEPAPTPSVWPGSQAALDAGYQWLEVAG